MADRFGMTPTLKPTTVAKRSYPVRLAFRCSRMQWNFDRLCFVSPGGRRGERVIGVRLHHQLVHLVGRGMSNQVHTQVLGYLGVVPN